MKFENSANIIVPGKFGAISIITKLVRSRYRRREFNGRIRCGGAILVVVAVALVFVVFVVVPVLLRQLLVAVVGA